MTSSTSIGCEGGAGKGQTDSPIPVGDDKHPGQGAGEVEKEICILDSSSAYRWEGGREGSVGCDPCQPSPRPVGEGEAEGGWRGLDDSQLFFVDTRETANYWDYWIYPGAILYHRSDERLLGEAGRPEGNTGPSPQSAPGPHCFNCGSAEHLLSSCPDPRNRALIDLSRQLFTFFADDTPQNRGRIHEVEEWKSRRLEWTRTYRPGEVTGFLLKDALGSRDAHGAPNMPWLENISLWGYPPGWVSCEDPIERVRRRILDREDPGTGGGGFADDSCLFVVLNDTPGDSETLQLKGSPVSAPSELLSGARTPRRWAAYPATYFLSDLLPVYAGRILPPLAEPVRLDVWCETLASPPCLPVQPPPSSDSPPPLPPSFPHDDPFDDEVDMDLSD